MMPEREYTDYLEDILNAIEKAASFIEGMKFEQFSRDDKTAFAVIRALEIVGEAAKNIPERIRASYPEMPWREMAGIRDKLIHGYFGVDLKVVWKTVTEDLPPLAPEISRILLCLPPSTRE